MLVVFDIDTSDQTKAAKEVCDVIELLMPRAMSEVRGLPPLYKSGVKYQTQDPRAVAMRYPRDVYERKHGDCKQLVLWRIAEHRVGGVNAKPRIIWLAEKNELVAHALIRLPDETTEDPSYNLGMKTP